MSNTTKKRALNNRSAKSRQRRKVKYTAGITGLGGVNGGNSKKNKGVEGIEGGVQQNKPTPIDEDGMHFEWHTDFTDKDTGQHFASGYAAAIIGSGGFVGYKALDVHRREKQEAQNKKTQKAAEEAAQKQEKKEPSKEDNLRRNFETIIPIGEGIINAYSRLTEHITKNGSTKGFEAQDAYEQQAVADVQKFRSPQDAVAWLKEEREKTQGTLDSVKKQLAALDEKPEEKPAPAPAPQKKPEDAVEKKEPPKPVEKPTPKEKTIKERKPIAPWKARTDAPTPEQAARMKHVKNILGKEWAKVWRRVADLKEAGKTKEARRVLLTAGNRYFNYAKEAYERWGDGEALSKFGAPSPVKEAEKTGENVAETFRASMNASLNEWLKETTPETLREYADSTEKKAVDRLAKETAAKETPVEEKTPEALAPDFDELDKQYDGLLASGALTENEADELAEIRDRAKRTQDPEDVKAFADKIADIDAKNNPPVFGEEEQTKEPETPAPVEDKQVEEQTEETPPEDVKKEESEEVKKARAVLDAEIRVYDHLRDWGSLRGFIPQNDFEREICKQIAGLKKKKALERIAGDARYRKQIIENGGIPKEEAETKDAEQAPQDAPVLEPGVSMNEIAERAAAVPDSDKFTATSPLGVKSYKEGYLDETFNDNVPEELRNDPEIQDAFRKAAAADVAALERNAGIEQDDKQHGAFNAEGDFTLPEEKKAVADFKRLVNKKTKTVADSEITGGLESIRRRREEARKELEELGGTPSPEGADAAEELRKFLGDYGINVDAPTVEEPKAEETSVEEQAEEAPVVEETPDSENPRRKGRAISILGVDMSETPSEEVKSKYPQGAKLGENLRRGLYDVLGKDRIETALTDGHSGDQNKISEFFQWVSNVEQMDRRPYEQVRTYNAILSELEAAGMGVALASLPFTSKLFSPQSYIWTKAVQDAQSKWHGKGNVVAWDDNWVAEGTPEYDAISNDKEIRNLWAKAEDSAYNARRYDDETRAITRGYRERGEEDRAAEQRRLKSASTRAFNKLANAIADKYEEITSKKDDAPNVAEEPSPEVAETTPPEAPAPVESSDAPVVPVVGEPNSVVGAVVGEESETPEIAAETPEEPSAEAASDAPVVDTTDAPESDVANANESADDISKRFEEELRNGKNARDMQDHLHYLGYKLRKQFQKEMRNDPVIQKAMLDYYDSPQSRIDAEILNRTVAARHSQWLKDRSVIKDRKPLPYSPDDIRKQIPEYYLNGPKQSESKKDYEERIKTEDKFNELISDSYGKTLWSQALKDYFESGYDGKQHLPVEIDVHAKGDPEIQKAFIEYVDKNGLKTWGEEWDSLQKLIKSKIEQFNAERNSNEQTPPEPPVIADEQTPVEKPAQEETSEAPAQSAEQGEPGRLIAKSGLDFSRTPSEETKKNNPLGAKIGAKMRDFIYRHNGEDKVAMSLNDEDGYFHNAFTLVKEIEESASPYNQKHLYNQNASQARAYGIDDAGEWPSFTFTKEDFDPESESWKTAVKDAESGIGRDKDVPAVTDDELSRIAENDDIRKLWAKVENADDKVAQLIDEYNAVKIKRAEGDLLSIDKKIRSRRSTLNKARRDLKDAVRDAIRQVYKERPASDVEPQTDAPIVDETAQNAPVVNETPKQKKRAPRPTAAPPRKSNAYYLHKEDDPYYRNGGDKGYRWQPEKTYESTWEDFNNEGPDRLGWTNDEATGERDFENDGDLRAARKEVMRRLLNDLGIDYDSSILKTTPVQRGINEYVKDAYNRFGAAGLKGNLEDNEEFAKDYEKIRDFVAEYSDVLAKHLHSINTDAFSVSPLNFRRQTAEQQRDTLERASKALDKILKTSKQKGSKSAPFNVEAESAFAKELSAAVKALKKGEEKPTSEIASLYDKARKMFMNVAAKQAMTSEFFDDSLEDVKSPVWEKNLLSGKKDAPVLDFFEDQKPETSDDIADAVNENIPDEESQANADAPVLEEQAETVEEEPETETPEEPEPPVVEETDKKQQGPVRFEDVYKGGGFDEPDLHKAVASPNGVRFGDDRRGGVMRADVKNGKLYVAPEKAFNPEKAMFNDVKQQLEDAGGKWNAATKEWEFPLTNKVLMKIRESTPLRGTVGQLSYQGFVNTPGVSVDERESVDNLYNTPFTQSDYGSGGRLTPWKVFKSAMIAKPSEFRRGIEYDKEIVGAIQKLLTDGKAAAEGLKDTAAKEAAADAVKRFKAFVKARFEQWKNDRTIFAEGTPLDEALYEKYVKPFDEPKEEESAQDAPVIEEPEQSEQADYFTDEFKKAAASFAKSRKRSMSQLIKEYDKLKSGLVKRELERDQRALEEEELSPERRAHYEYVVKELSDVLNDDLDPNASATFNGGELFPMYNKGNVSFVVKFDPDVASEYENILEKNTFYKIPGMENAFAFKTDAYPGAHSITKMLKSIANRLESMRNAPQREEPREQPQEASKEEESPESTQDAPVVSEEVAETEETPTGEETETVDETAEPDAPVVTPEPQPQASAPEPVEEPKPEKPKKQRKAKGAISDEDAEDLNRRFQEATSKYKEGWQTDFNTAHENYDTTTWDVTTRELIAAPDEDRDAFRKEALKDPVIQSAFLEMLDAPMDVVKEDLLDEGREERDVEAVRKFQDVVQRRFQQWYKDRSCIKKRKPLPGQKSIDVYRQATADAPVIDEPAPVEDDKKKRV